METTIMEKKMETTIQVNVKDYQGLGRGAGARRVEACLVSRV